MHTASQDEGRRPEDLPVLEQLPGAPRDWALFLDLDGTLIDIADTPEAVIVPPEMPATLAGLERLFEGAVAVVTGRKLADVDRMLGPVDLPVAGLHGAALRLDGRVLASAEEAALPPALLAALHDFAACHEGLLLEPKGASIAVHYRAAPALGGLVEEEVGRLVRDTAPRHEIQPGKMVYEIKPRGVDKGRAVATLLSTDRFRGRRAAFFGDDLTDEAGFRSAQESGGLAAIVGTPDRQTVATHRLQDPAAVRRFLADLIRNS